MEFTEYELERKPQEINMASIEMAISSRCFNREIVCPICIDILDQTRAAPDCLHRFCKKCIQHIVKKDCPVCGKRLPSQVKSFREDTRFDQLISKICQGYSALRPLEINREQTAPDCEIVLRHVIGQQTRYLKCPEDTTIDHLARYLAIRPEGSRVPNLENTEEYKLCLVANISTGHYELLPGALKLMEIRNIYRLNTEQPLELFYYSQ